VVTTVSDARSAPEQTAVAERRRALADRRLALVRDWELRRRGLHRALHDRAQQQLLGLRMEILREHRHDELDRASAVTRIDEIGDEIERLARGLPPSALRIDDMPAALAELAAQSGIAVDLELPPAVPASVVVGELLTYTAGEALANVLRHSHADRCALALHVDAGVTRLVVRDPGPAQQPGAAEVHAGHGLAGLRARAELLGGRLDVHFGSDGTTVTLEVPTIDATSSTACAVAIAEADEQFTDAAPGELVVLWDEQVQVARRTSAIEAALARRLTTRPLDILARARRCLTDEHDPGGAAGALLDVSNAIREIVTVLGSDESSVTAADGSDPFLFALLGRDFGVEVRVDAAQLPPRAERDAIVAMGEQIIVDSPPGSQLTLRVLAGAGRAVLRAFLDRLPSPRAFAFIEDTVTWWSGELACEPCRDGVRLQAVLPCGR